MSSLPPSPPSGSAHTHKGPHIRHRREGSTLFDLDDLRKAIAQDLPTGSVKPINKDEFKPSASGAGQAPDGRRAVTTPRNPFLATLNAALADTTIDDMPMVRQIPAPKLSAPPLGRFVEMEIPLETVHGLAVKPKPKYSPSLSPIAEVDHQADELFDALSQVVSPKRSASFLERESNSSCDETYR